MSKRFVALVASLLPLGPAVAQDWIEVGDATWMSVDHITNENGELSSAIDPDERRRLEGYFLLYDHFLAHRLDEITGDWKPCAPVLEVDRWFTDSRHCCPIDWVEKRV